MKPCPEVMTFQSANGPSGIRWLAKFVVRTRAKKDGPLRTELLPLEFYSSTEEGAIIRAEQ